MKAKEFCYWLQGHLELAGPSSQLDARQVELVARHLKMVRIHDGAAGGWAGAFCQWLEGLAEAHLELAPPAGLSPAKREHVQARLFDVFRNEIDRAYPADQWDALSRAHWGEPDVQDGPDAGLGGQIGGAAEIPDRC